MALAKSTKDRDELPGFIHVLNRQRRFKVSRSSVALFCANVLRSFPVHNGMLSIALVNPGQMRAINRRYLDHDYATDVLSFSYKKTRMEGRRFLGEIVIAPEVAAVHAARYGTAVEKEVRKLLVHGILHLLGYDHETDRGEMIRLQNTLLRRKTLSDSLPLIALKETP